MGILTVVAVLALFFVLLQVTLTLRDISSSISAIRKTIDIVQSDLTDYILTKN